MTAASAPAISVRDDRYSSALSRPQTMGTSSIRGRPNPASASRRLRSGGSHVAPAIRTRAGIAAQGLRSALAKTEKQITPSTEPSGRSTRSASITRYSTLVSPRSALRRRAASTIVGAFPGRVRGSSVPGTCRRWRVQHRDLPGRRSSYPRPGLRGPSKRWLKSRDGRMSRPTWKSSWRSRKRTI